MKKLEDSTEIKEVSKLFSELVADSAIIAPATMDPNWPKVLLAEPVYQTVDQNSLIDPTAPPFPFSEVGDPEPEIIYRGDQLEDTLIAMCKRGGFNGAIVADSNGFPLAAYNIPVGDEVMAAFASVLGMALEGAGNLLDQHEANYIAMDINFTEKAVMRQFPIDNKPFYILIICPQEVDEKAEIELSVEQITTIIQ